MQEINAALLRYIEGQSIPIFAVSGAEGYGHASPEWHPKDLMARCRSVIIIGHPFV